jgi:hypothetical protein
MKSLKFLRYWLKFADASESNKWLRIVYYVLFPISLMLETVAFFWCWRFIFIPEMLVNEDTVNWFDNNEFGMKWYKIWKKDVVEADSFLDKLSIDELNLQVSREMRPAILKLIQESSNIDLEEYVTLQTKVDIIPEGKIKVYTVTLQYYRYWVVRRNWLRYLPLWLMSVFLLSLVYREGVHLYAYWHLGQFFSKL